MLFPLLFSDGRQPGDSMSVKVLRDGERLDLQMPLRAMRPEEDRVAPYVFGRGPDYVVAGGLVFEELPDRTSGRGATGRAARRPASWWRSTASRTGPRRSPGASFSSRASSPTPPTSGTRSCET